MTAIAAMQVVERGLIAFDDDVAELSWLNSLF
jgi:CubicO group peptidase (beta-lactamase class C family)